MRKVICAVLALSVIAMACGIALGIGKLTTGAMALSGCMAGTLIGDMLKNKKGR